MKLYFADVGGGGLYCTTMQEASRYAESILKDYGFAVSIWRVNTKRITPEVFCSTVNGGGHTAFLSLIHI